MIETASLSSHEAEQSVIGAVLIDPSVLDKVSLRPSMFSFRPHRLIWTEIIRLRDAYRQIDFITVGDSIESVGLLDEIGGIAYLADLAKSTPTARNASAYASIVLDRAKRRRTISMYEKLIERCRDLNDDVDSIRIDAIEQAMQHSPNVGSVATIRPVSELCEEWLDEYEERVQGKAKPGLTTGFKNLDDFLAPKQVVDGSLFVIGARPKMGKTAKIIRQVDHICGECGHDGLMFSMEMSDTQLVERSLTQIGNIPSRVMYPTKEDSNGFTDENLAKLSMTIGRFKEYPLHISTKAAINAMEMEAMIRTHYAATNGRLRAVWVDYLTLMDVDAKHGRYDLGYAAITKRLKQLAKELGLVVFLLIQLNRSLESRPDKRPMPSDGRETGQIEQDCDYWLGIYREHVYKPEADPTFTELILRLNRHGPAGTVYASFAGGRFSDWHGEAPVNKVASQGSMSW